MNDSSEHRCGRRAGVPVPSRGRTPRTEYSRAGREQISRTWRVRYDSMMLRYSFAALLWVAIVCAGVQPVFAIEAFAALLFAADGVTDADAAARAAAAMSGGRVLDVQKDQDGDKQVFNVKVLQDDGRVRIIRLDGESPAAPTPGGE